MKTFSLLALMFAASTAGAVACRDFATQEEAQRYHEEHGDLEVDGEGGHERRVDGDRDGEACECLPGGSAYGSPKCNRG